MKNLNDDVKIEKIKIRMVYILWLVAMITFLVASCMQSDTSKLILLLVGIAIFILSIVINYKYIRCTNCDSVIWSRDLKFDGGPGFCKSCGSKIIYK